MNAQQRSSASAPDPSKRSVLQQIALAAAALSLGTALTASTPEASEAYLVQFPVADLRNQYYLVRTQPALYLPCQLATEWLTT